jgi:phosphatidylinositol-3-phosphatase
MIRIPAVIAAALAALAVAGALLLGGGGPAPPASLPIEWPAGLPVYDHIVIVVEENKDYDQIIDNPAAPYINDTLCAEGASLTQMFGEEHNSQGNYFWLFSGSNHNIGFRDVVPSSTMLRSRSRLSRRESTVSRRARSLQPSA